MWDKLRQYKQKHGNVHRVYKDELMTIFMNISPVVFTQCNMKIALVIYKCLANIVVNSIVKLQCLKLFTIQIVVDNFQSTIVGNQHALVKACFYT